MITNKSKSIIIDAKIHEDFKNLCKENCLKLGAVVESLMLYYISNPILANKYIEESKLKK